MCVYTCSQFGRKRRSFQHNTYTVHFAQYDICSMKDIYIVLMLQSNVLNRKDDILYIKYVQHIQYLHTYSYQMYVRMYLYCVHTYACIYTVYIRMYVSILCTYVCMYLYCVHMYVCIYTVYIRMYVSCT